MEKNPKACEPCRRRKIRCDGATPCNRCGKKPSECTYRLRTRIRKRKSERVAAATTAAAAPAVQIAAAADGSQPHAEQTIRFPVPAEPVQYQTIASNPKVDEAEQERKVDSAYNTVYQSVTAAHEHGGGREWTENSRLYYGPASQFAFLHQVHRGIISSSGSQGQPDREVQEGGAGLDLFLQRTFFFGTASRVDKGLILRPASSLFPEIPLGQAKLLLDAFKAGLNCMIPLFNDHELDAMLQNAYGDAEQSQARPSQMKALTTLILAIGALATPHTDVAEMLLQRAKYEAVLFEDTVSLPMIQFSLLVAMYQTDMGRPNLVYLSLGTACRKAFALGLHRESVNCRSRPEEVQRYRTTLWGLYSLENLYSITVGREHSLKWADIASPFPDDKPILVSLSKLAHLAENMERMIYTQRYDSLRKLYKAAEDVHAQLREFASSNSIGPASEGHTALSQNPASLILHSLYYHTILLTFRPFLVADHALKTAADRKGDAGANGPGVMWLRQACRTAIDAAQDCILYAHTQIRKHDPCRAIRYNGYFFESSCAVLLFDILRHPSKYPYNAEYINMALQSLDTMINDEPVTNARKSIRQILRIVEDTISRKGAGVTATPGVLSLTNPLLQQTPASSRFTNHQQQQTPGPSSADIPSTAVEPLSRLSNPDQQVVFFPDLGGDAGAVGHSLSMHRQDVAADESQQDSDWMDPLSHFHYDILATDLHSFFPLNMTPPDFNGGEAVAVVDEASLVS